MFVIFYEGNYEEKSFFFSFLFFFHSPLSIDRYFVCQLQFNVREQFSMEIEMYNNHFSFRRFYSVERAFDLRSVDASIYFKLKIKKKETYRTSKIMIYTKKTEVIYSQNASKILKCFQRKRQIINCLIQVSIKIDTNVI